MCKEWCNTSKCAEPAKSGSVGVGGAKALSVWCHDCGTLFSARMGMSACWVASERHTRVFLGELRLWDALRTSSSRCRHLQICLPVPAMRRCATPRHAEVRERRSPKWTRFGRLLMPSWWGCHTPHTIAWPPNRRPQRAHAQYRVAVCHPREPRGRPFVQSLLALFGRT